MSELIGAELDAAVARAQGWEQMAIDQSAWYENRHWRANAQYYIPSTDWSQGGPIIERERIEIVPYSQRSSDWYAIIVNEEDGLPKFEAHGATPLIAAMRAFVASKA